MNDKEITLMFDEVLKVEDYITRKDVFEFWLEKYKWTVASAVKAVLYAAAHEVILDIPSITRIGFRDKVNEINMQFQKDCPRSAKVFEKDLIDYGDFLTLNSFGFESNVNQQQSSISQIQDLNPVKENRIIPTVSELEDKIYKVFKVSKEKYIKLLLGLISNKYNYGDVFITTFLEKIKLENQAMKIVGFSYDLLLKNLMEHSHDVDLGTFSDIVFNSYLAKYDKVKNYNYLNHFSKEYFISLYDQIDPELKHMVSFNIDDLNKAKIFKTTEILDTENKESANMVGVTSIPSMVNAQQIPSLSAPIGLPVTISPPIIQDSNLFENNKDSINLKIAISNTFGLSINDYSMSLNSHFTGLYYKAKKFGRNMEKEFLEYIMTLGQSRKLVDFSYDLILNSAPGEFKDRGIISFSGLVFEVYFAKYMEIKKLVHLKNPVMQEKLIELYNKVDPQCKHMVILNPPSQNLVPDQVASEPVKDSSKDIISGGKLLIKFKKQDEKKVYKKYTNIFWAYFFEKILKQKLKMKLNEIEKLGMEPLIYSKKRFSFSDLPSEEEIKKITKAIEAKGKTEVADELLKVYDSYAHVIANA